MADSQKLFSINRIRFFKDTIMQNECSKGAGKTRTRNQNIIMVFTVELHYLNDKYNLSADEIFG